MTSTTTVFVRLLAEGLDVWRPVPAQRLDGDYFRLLKPDDFGGDAEIWEFPPHSVVRCEQLFFEGESKWIAIATPLTP
ncbi:hypothetical protein FRC96_06975 [Lujinxingia vulgaris]|uniref:Uncharacterized protein n=1 Tax=Lujinxingia vulgaris TaxID=2600176 RepID=A0A5C6XQA6_9DELT|nr:hypothetical protein [Lujinxingia vulgaris]TXD39594.1 hypothetical protein FRC96_06975 [Lujinxingia vulgaris]